MNRSFAGNVGTGGGSISTVDQLLNDREAAKLLGCGRSTLWRWASEGVIPKPIKIGGLSRWRQSWIEAVIHNAETNRGAA